mgnify:CR=1 FL=1
MSFIKFSGIQLLINTLDELKNRGIKGKIVTSVYLNITDPKALRKLAEYDNLEIKIYNNTRESFHTKAYLFHRKEYSSCIIGSSNLSQSALYSGEEWNVRLVKDNYLEIFDQSYEQFEKIILVHGVRYEKDLAYYDRFTKELPEHEYLGEMVKEKLIYYPVVSREEYPHRGHITDLMMSGKMFEDIGLPMMNPEHDRAMLCGSPAMLKDTSGVLDHFGLKVSPKMGQRGDYLIERAFVDQ